jgi:hypothetical protein
MRRRDPGALRAAVVLSQRELYARMLLDPVRLGGSPAALHAPVTLIDSGGAARMPAPQLGPAGLCRQARLRRRLLREGDGGYGGQTYRVI